LRFPPRQTTYVASWRDRGEGALAVVHLFACVIALRSSADGVCVGVASRRPPPNASFAVVSKRAKIRESS